MDIIKDEQEKQEEFEMLVKKNPHLEPDKIRSIIDQYAEYQELLRKANHL